MPIYCSLCINWLRAIRMAVTKHTNAISATGLISWVSKRQTAELIRRYWNICTLTWKQELGNPPVSFIRHQKEFNVAVNGAVRLNYRCASVSRTFRIFCGPTIDNEFSVGICWTVSSTATTILNDCSIVWTQFSWYHGNLWHSNRIQPIRNRYIRSIWCTMVNLLSVFA